MRRYQQSAGRFFAQHTAHKPLTYFSHTLALPSKNKLLNSTLTTKGRETNSKFISVYIQAKKATFSMNSGTSIRSEGSNTNLMQADMLK